MEAIFETGPQDIEWGVDPDGALFLLQSRPITNLPPPPLEDVDWTPAYPAKLAYGPLHNIDLSLPLLLTQRRRVLRGV